MSWLISLFMGILHSSFFTWFGNIACYRYKVFNKALKRIQDDSQVSVISYLSISALIMMNVFLSTGVMVL